MPKSLLAPPSLSQALLPVFFCFFFFFWSEGAREPQGS